MREEPIETRLPVESATPTRELDHGVEPPGSQEDQGVTPVVWMPADDE